MALFMDGKMLMFVSDEMIIAPGGDPDRWKSHFRVTANGHQEQESHQSGKVLKQRIERIDHFLGRSADGQGRLLRKLDSKKAVGDVRPDDDCALPASGYGYKVLDRLREVSRNGDSRIQEARK